MKPTRYILQSTFRSNLQDVPVAEMQKKQGDKSKEKQKMYC